VQNTLKLQDDKDEQTNAEIEKFVAKSAEILFKMYISDPRMVMDLSTIGEKVKFNQMKMDSFDGFIKAGNDCIVILPPVYREGGDLLMKSNVLPLDYEFP
jgi:hypothetical protein